ncbi:hypothetical protein LZ31DRAFT_559588 [Colletotrichum somersetense]|nr:hypothetical protein LZ31DRAFT_559588 [Colletotrichum somersetense]
MDRFAATEGIEPHDSYSRMEPFSASETAIERDLRLRIRDFYRTSDRRDQDERWLDFYTPGARAKVGALEGEERENIRQLRTALWSTVSARKHWLTSAIGSATEKGVHVMLKGGVRRKGLDGSEKVFSWAGSAEWVRQQDGEWRMDAYRVWLDPWTEIDGELPAVSQF